MPSNVREHRVELVPRAFLVFLVMEMCAVGQGMWGLLWFACYGLISLVTVILAPRRNQASARPERPKATMAPGSAISGVEGLEVFLTEFALLVSEGLGRPAPRDCNMLVAALVDYIVQGRQGAIAHAKKRFYSLNVSPGLDIRGRASTARGRTLEWDVLVPVSD